MKETATRRISLWLTSALILSAFACERSVAVNPATITGPRIEFDSLTNDFGHVLAGAPIKHVFTFTNVGTQDLLITNVRPGCGCTTAGSWTRLTKPGETGVIPIQLQTAALSGSVDKVITMSCNDPSQPTAMLSLKGSAQKAIDIHPPIAILNLQPDSPFAAANIRITNCLREPLVLSSLQTTNLALGAELKTNVPGQDYLISISNTIPLPPGPLAVAFTLKTSLTNLPAIRLFAVASVFPTFTVEPDRLNLPTTPASNQSSYVKIVNNSSNAVTLSDPQVNASGVNVSLDTRKPGSIFVARLVFPQGYRIASGETNSLSIRTSNPLYPVIQVPILQVSNAVPPAPFLTEASSQTEKAGLPLGFQTDAIDSLKLNEEQLGEIEELRTQFIEEIGGLGQDPSDPAYLDRWQRARPKVDARLTGVVGQRALVHFDTSVDATSATAQ